MKLLKVLLVILILAAVVTVFSGCKAGAKTAAPTTQTVTVTRGNISQKISAAGNLAFSNTQNLAFDVGGFVANINVKIGDTVKKGQVLASLDTTQYNQNIASLQNSITVAQHSLLAKQQTLVVAQRNIITAQNALVNKQLTVQSDQLAVQSAQLAIQSANNTLYSIQLVAAAQDDVEAAELYVKAINIAMGSLSGGGYIGTIDATTLTYWHNQQLAAASMLVEAKAHLQDVLNNVGMTLPSDVALQIEQAELNIVLKQQALLNAQQTVVNDQHAVGDAQFAVTQAQQSADSATYDVNQSQINLQNAQQNLDQANTQNPNIVAPFDGFISAINVTGGTQVYKGSLAMTIADPTQFETQIFMSEINISTISTGTTGTLSANAISGASFPVQVTYISPTATIASNVVNYSVTTNITSLIPIITASSTFPRQSSGNFTLPGGTIPGSGTFTPPAGGFNPSANSTALRNRPENPFSQNGTSSNSTIIKKYTLMSGMSVIVTLNIPLSTNVLIVPIAAVKTQGGQSSVVVLNADGTTQDVTVTTGNSDDANIEITSGLNEGQKVVISSAAKSSSSKTTTPTGRPPGGGGGIFFGG